MNTELDGPLAVWGGRALAIGGIFGVFVPVLFFTTGINLFPGIPDDGVIGLGAIIASTCGGPGGAMIIKTHFHKKFKKEQLSSPCNAVRKTGKHDYVEQRDKIIHTTYRLELPAKCKECGHETTFGYEALGELK